MSSDSASNQDDLLCKMGLLSPTIHYDDDTVQFLTSEATMFPSSWATVEDSSIPILTASSSSSLSGASGDISPHWCKISGSSVLVRFTK